MERGSFGKYTIAFQTPYESRELKSSAFKLMWQWTLFVDVIVALFCFIPNPPWTDSWVKCNVNELLEKWNKPRDKQNKTPNLALLLD